MTSIATVLEFFEAETEDQCKRAIYKHTDCGAWIEFTATGIVIGSIVEGCNFGTATYPLHYASNFGAKDIQDRIDAVEKEATDLWEWANTGPDDSDQTWADTGIDAPDTSTEFSHYEQGERSA